MPNPVPEIPGRLDAICKGGYLGVKIQIIWQMWKEALYPAPPHRFDKTPFQERGPETKGERGNYTVSLLTPNPEVSPGNVQPFLCFFSSDSGKIRVVRPVVSPPVAEGIMYSVSNGDFGYFQRKPERLGQTRVPQIHLEGPLRIMGRSRQIRRKPWLR
ncbi:hypothetical protein GCM10022626_03670 [[Pseudomonas] carboxydohydrogena]